MINETISHYKILEKVGEGGMGVVYKAQDLKLDRVVALKFLPPEFTRDSQARARFINEAKAASALDHPNICTVYEVGETVEQHFFIAMAYYAGETLSERVKSGTLEVNELIRIALEVAEGLKAAHEQKIVHRDIKSSNIMLRANGQVKIMDFGLARRLDQTMLTKTGSTLGTVPYMSPEQARGEHTDHRTDIWSLGVVLYEMITGRLPFQSPYNEAVIYSILNEDPPPLASLLSSVPAQLEHIVLKALQKDPSNRYQVVADLLGDLTTLQQKLVGGVELPVAKMRSKKKISHIYGAAALLATLVVTVVLYFSQGDVEGIHSLAVLPLVNLSGDPEQDYFAEGIHEALLTDFAKLSGLRRVIARQSAMRYQKTDKPLSQIARELNVEALITGSVLRSGNRVRISVQLINPKKDQQIWAERYERDLRDVLAVQNEIVSAITQQIKLHLSPQEQVRLANAKQVNPEAYEAYLKGMFYLNKFTTEGFEKGLTYLQKAIDNDPADPYAYAGLALGYCLIGHERFPDAFIRAKAAARRAQELGGMLAETQLALAEIKFYSDWDIEGAGSDLRNAVELNPSLAEAHRHYSWYLNVTGRRDEAFAEMRRAEAVDPLSPVFAADIGWQYWLAGKNDSAIVEARRSLELDHNFAAALTVVGYGYAAKEMYEDAVGAHQKAAVADKDWRWPLGRTYALAGRRDEARELAAELKKKPTPLNAWGLAGIYAALGEKDEAFRWLETAHTLRFSWMPWIRMDPSFLPLRDDPRFQAMARRLTLPN